MPRRLRQAADRSALTGSRPVRASSRWLAVAAMTAAVTSCGDTGSDRDRLGGRGDSEPVTLEFANSNIGVPAQLNVFADEVNDRSGGSVAIEFHDGWRHGDADFETEIIADVRSGEVDMAWVGARVFDELGVGSFQALLAPLLVDSHELQGAVFGAGIPDEMLRPVDELDVVGVAVLPGPMQHIVGVDHPFLTPADFAGEIVGVQPSRLADRALVALGAEPRAMPVGALLGSVEGYVTTSSAIVGNDYPLVADYVTAGADLWPLVFVVIINPDVHESLSDAQQNALRDAATRAVPGALQAARERDDVGAAAICATHMTTVSASDDQLAALRDAVQPVYDELRADETTAGYLDRIEALKADVRAPAGSAACTRDDIRRRSWRGPILPDGTYSRVVTTEEALEWYPPDRAAALLGSDGEMTISLQVDGDHWALSRDGSDVDRGDSFYDAAGNWVRRSDRCSGCVWVLRWTVADELLSLELVPNHAQPYEPADVL
jgi:TRAP-type C4-dicarboxylate transport system substrate-binding protein